MASEVTVLHRQNDGTEKESAAPGDAALEKGQES
jgi:hypothetical protein